MKTTKQTAATPDPTTETRAFREWVYEKAFDFIQAYGDDAFFSQDIVEDLMNLTPLPRRGKPQERLWVIEGIRKQVEGGVAQVLRGFGIPIDEKGGDPDAYCPIPRNGEYGRSYFRRRGAMTVAEMRACLNKALKERRRNARLAEWWKDAIAQTKGAQVSA